MVDRPVKFRDNRKKIERAILRGLINGIEDLADRICELGAEQVAVKTGNLQRSISSERNMGRTIKVGDDPPKFIQVPIHLADVDRNKFRIAMKFGAYAPYAAAVEFGTGPHIIEPRKDRAEASGQLRTNPHLRWKTDGGGEVFAKRVKHPGTTAQPFMRPAVDTVRKKEFLPLMQNAITEELDQSPGQAQRARKQTELQ